MSTTTWKNRIRSELSEACKAPFDGPRDALINLLDEYSENVSVEIVEKPFESLQLWKVWRGRAHAEKLDGVCGGLASDLRDFFSVYSELGMIVAVLHSDRLGGVVFFSEMENVACACYLRDS